MNIMQTGAVALIREWRQRRRMSQLSLAMEAEISQRHLSFVESGRSAPSREMVLRLADQLSVPLRQRNRLLVAAGFAPVYGERARDDPALKPALTAVEMVLKGHEPYPAIAVDKGWNMVLANAATALLDGVEEPALLSPPVNVLRRSLHPKGLAPRIVNLDEWRTHLIERLRMQIDATADPALEALETELSAYPGRPRANGRPYDATANISVPLRLRSTASCYLSSAPSLCSARHSTPRFLNWRSNHSFRWTRRPGRSCAGWPPGRNGD